MFRKATKNDIDRISEIYDELHTLEEAGKVTIGWVRGVYPTYRTAETGVELRDMFVEEIDGIIVAAARINKEQVDEYGDVQWSCDPAPEKIMVLHALVVSPKIKGRGYGTAFVNFYEKYAIENGCPYLRMDTNAKNLVARNLYKKLGYSEVSIVPCVFNGIEGVQLVCLEKNLVSEKA